MPGEKARGRVRVAAAQAASVFLDRDSSVDKACDLIVEAGRNGAKVVGFPEGFVPAHPIWFHYHPVLSDKSVEFGTELFLNAVEVPSRSTDALCEAAADAGAFVVMGVCERRPGTTGTLYNTQVFIDDSGKVVGRHRKLMPTIGERIVHTGGSAEGLRAYRSHLGAVSGLVCGENSNPLAVFALASESTNIHVASWPPMFHKTPGPMARTVDFVSKSLAYVMKAFVISACGALDEPTLEALAVDSDELAHLAEPGAVGGSLITAPGGEVVAGPMGSEEGLLYADIDLAATVRAKLVQDYAGHYNRPDVFQLHVDSRPMEFVVRSETGEAAQLPAGLAQLDARRNEALEGGFDAEAPKAVGQDDTAEGSA